MEKSQKLGIKVFYYYLYKDILIGGFLLILSIIVSLFKAELISKFSIFINTNSSTLITNYLIDGLFFLSVFILIIGIIASYFKYISSSFIIGENTFTIRNGILNKKETSIPYQQIQAMNIEQSFSQRLMGICELHMLTAGDDDNDKKGEAEADFHVIDFKIATNLKEVVLAKTNIKN